jgi:hypothetical protein
MRRQRCIKWLVRGTVSLRDASGVRAVPEPNVVREFTLPTISRVAATASYRLKGAVGPSSSYLWIATLTAAPSQSAPVAPAAVATRQTRRYSRATSWTMSGRFLRRGSSDSRRVSTSRAARRATLGASPVPAASMRSLAMALILTKTRASGPRRFPNPNRRNQRERDRREQASKSAHSASRQSSWRSMRSRSVMTATTVGAPSFNPPTSTRG